MAALHLDVTRMVAGGAGLARDASGRVVFVEGAIAGERVAAEVVEERRDFSRARAVAVLDASPDRVRPPCPNVALGCGACGWQHLGVGAQRRHKEDIVRDALRRIARIPEDRLPSVETVGLSSQGFRTTVRVAVEGGRARFHSAGSSALAPASGCLVAHPLVAEVLDEGDFAGARRAVVRAGAATGERAALLLPRAHGARLPPGVVVGGHVREVVGGRTLRASIRSFFQPSPEAAAALVREVLASVDAGRPDGAVERVADLYSGVGLFAGALGERHGARVVAVERDPAASTDAEVNLRDLDATVVRSEVGAWRPDALFDVVVADPARPGLGRPGVAAVRAAAPKALVLVSCDPASLARDTALLAASGFRLVRLRLVDAFVHTPHIEAVALFDGRVMRA